MPHFDRLNDARLNTLADEEILAYIDRARVAGNADAATEGLQVLVFGYADAIAARVARKVPAHDVEDLAHVALVSAIQSSLDGREVGQFRAWLNTIVDRRIADYHRGRQGKPDLVPFPPAGDDGDAGFETAIEPGDIVDLSFAVEQAQEGLTDVHRRVVEVAVLGDQSAETTIATVTGEFGDRLTTPLTPDNIYKIASRFRRRLREILAAAEAAVEPPPPPASPASSPAPAQTAAQSRPPAPPPQGPPPAATPVTAPPRDDPHGDTPVTVA